MREETFAPILYALKYREFEDAIAIHNDVPQGLASCIFTTDLREAERFMAAAGSDCGIVNVNIGPSGRGDRRRLRRREADRRRPRVRLRRLEGLHAPRHQHHQLLERAAARPGHQVRRRVTREILIRQELGEVGPGSARRWLSSGFSGSAGAAASSFAAAFFSSALRAQHDRVEVALGAEAQQHGIARPQVGEVPIGCGRAPPRWSASVVPISLEIWASLSSG